MDPSNLEWRKSARSGGTNCVEVAFCEDGQVAVRDSKHREGPILVVTAHEWEAFIGGVRDGEFN